MFVTSEGLLSSDGLVVLIYVDTKCQFRDIF